MAKNDLAEPARKLSVLAIGAHPDDIELGCGGSLAKLAQAGASIEAVVFSKGRRGALSDSDRAAETETALRSLGFGHEYRMGQVFGRVIEADSVLSRASPSTAITRAGITGCSSMGLD